MIRNTLQRMKHAITTSTLLGVGIFAFWFQPAMASSFDSLNIVEENASVSLAEFIQRLLTVFFGLLAVILVAILIYAGYQYMTSQGDPEKVQKATRTIRNAIIGLLIIAAAFAIAQFILRLIFGDSFLTDGNNNNSGSGCVGCSVPAGSANFYVIATNPEAGETNVQLCYDVTVRMNEDVDTTTVNEDTWYLEVYNGLPAGAECSTNNACSSGSCQEGACVGDHVAGEIGYGPGDTTKYFNFVPDVDLEQDTTYQATVVGGTSGVLSLDETPDDNVDDREAMSSNYTWQFVTGSDTDNVPPQVLISASSPFPADGEADVCLNTVVNVDFSESIRITSVNDETSFVVDAAGTVDNPVAPDWEDTVGLYGWSFGGDFDYVQARPSTALEPNSLYSTRVFAGDADNNFAGAIVDSCGNPLDGDADGIAEGSTVDNFFGFDPEAADSEEPLTWETGENDECTPIVESFSPSSDFYGEYSRGEDGLATPTLTISGQYLTPHAEIRMEGSDVWASSDFKTCFDLAHYGNVPASTAVGDYCVDEELQSSTQLQLRTPVGAADTNVWVTVAGEESDTLDQELDVLSPQIATLSPSNGSVGQYVTISGQNFGSVQGSGEIRVVSFDENGNTQEGKLELPEACGETWASDQVVAVISDEYVDQSGETGTWVEGDVVYIQIMNDSGRYSDLQEFTFADVDRPNLCSVAPSCNDAGGATVTLTGDNFGASQGQNAVAFAVASNEGYNASSYTSWSADAIVAVTDENMTQNQYWTSVYDAESGLSSNAVRYEIPCSPGPEVVTIGSCNQAEGIYPSPSPQANDGDACLNANIGVLFDQEIDTATINSNSVFLEQYNTCSDSNCTFDSSVTPSSVSGDFITRNWSYDYLSETYYGFQYNVYRTTDSSGAGSNYLQPNTWYQLTITTEVANTDGAGLAEPYTLRFKTDDTEALCEVDSIDVAPQSSTQNTYWDDNINDVSRESYTGTPYDAACNLLDASSYTWNWTTSDANIGHFARGADSAIGADSTQNVFVAGSDNANEGTAEIRVEASGTADTADFTVALGYCETDADCSINANLSSTCNTAVNACNPLITDFTPTNGATGTYMTINGYFFGGSQGVVAMQSEDDSAYAIADFPEAQECVDETGDTWTSTQIVVEVPETTEEGDALALGNYRVEVNTYQNLQDITDDFFELNETLQPGICAINPDEGYILDSVSVAGQNLGSTEGEASFLSTDDYDGNGISRVSAQGNYTSWSDETVITRVAEGSTTGLSADGEEGFKLIMPGADETCAQSGSCSNSLDFTVSCTLNSDCDSGVCSESGICVEQETASCTQDADCMACGIQGQCSDTGFCLPQITNLSPDSGPAGGPVTVQGCYFGSFTADSAVTFTDATGNAYEAGLFCTDGWSDTQIITEIVSDIPPLEVAQVTVTNENQLTSESAEFTVTAQCSNGVPIPATGHPVLCSLNPTSGVPASDAIARNGDSVTMIGENVVDPNAVTSAAYFEDSSNSYLLADNFAYVDSTEASGSVPYQTRSEGEVFYAADSCISNGLEFTAACNTTADCADGVCVEGICVATVNECADGIDNDADTFIDYGTEATNDPQCEAPQDTSEDESMCSISECSGTDDTNSCGDGNGCYESFGNFCCGGFPTLTSSSVTDGATNFCPNSYIELTFSEYMIGEENIILEEVTQSSAEAATYEVVQEIPLTVTNNSTTFTITVIPDEVLSTSTQYRLTIPGEVSGVSSSVRSDLTGLTTSNGTQEIFFVTLATECEPYDIQVINDDTGESGSYTFTAPDQETSFTATMYAENGQPLTSTGNADYSWEWSWSPYFDEQSCQNVAWVDLDAESDAEGTINATSETQAALSGNEHNGTETFTVTASRLDINDQIQESFNVSTFFCEEDEIWEYYDDENVTTHSLYQNFRLVYCDGDEEPTFSEPTVIENTSASAGQPFLTYLFYNNDESISERQEAFGIQVFSNNDLLTPDEWYYQNIGSEDDSLSETTVDGYAAVRNGYTYYIAATNIYSDGDSSTTDPLYSNIYAIAFNGDEEAVLTTANQLMEYAQFNTNVSYASCEGSDKDRLVRDTKRATDLGTISSLARDYYSTNSEFPLPQSSTFGSYINNITTSVWNSWQGALGNLFGRALPEDPYNAFITEDVDPWDAGSQSWISDDDAIQDCEPNPEDGDDFDENGTCWDQQNQTFYCPANSSTYLYKRDRTDSDLAYIYTRMEYNGDDGFNGPTEDFGFSETTLNPCSDVLGVSAVCSCYNYGIMSDVNNPQNGSWVETGS